jgi:hypothetical protein
MISVFTNPPGWAGFFILKPASAMRFAPNDRRRPQGSQLAFLRYARRRRATVEGRSLTTGGGRVSPALTGIGSGDAALGLAREPALPRLDAPYSVIERGAPHSSADTHGAQRSFCGIRRTAPRQRSQLLSTLWLWTYFKNASSSASSMRQ